MLILLFRKINITLQYQNIKRVLQISNSIIESIKISEKAHLRSYFRKKKLPWVGLEPKKEIYFRAEIQKKFVRFLVQMMKALKFAADIYWPLVIFCGLLRIPEFNKTGQIFIKTYMAPWKPSRWPWSSFWVWKGK